MNNNDPNQAEDESAIRRQQRKPDNHPISQSSNGDSQTTGDVDQLSPSLSENSDSTSTGTPGTGSAVSKRRKRKPRRKKTQLIDFVDMQMNLSNKIRSNDGDGVTEGRDKGKGKADTENKRGEGGDRGGRRRNRNREGNATKDDVTIRLAKREKNSLTIQNEPSLAPSFYQAPVILGKRQSNSQSQQGEQKTTILGSDANLNLFSNSASSQTSQAHLSQSSFKDSSTAAYPQPANIKIAKPPSSPTVPTSRSQSQIPSQQKQVLLSRNNDSQASLDSRSSVKASAASSSRQSTRPRSSKDMEDSNYSSTSKSNKPNPKKQVAGVASGILKSIGVLNSNQNPSRSHGGGGRAGSNSKRADDANSILEVNRGKVKFLEKRNVVKFMDHLGRIQLEDVAKLLAEHPGCFVVGIIGRQGVGKSTILSAFTQNPSMAFPVQTQENQTSATHKTVGIDLYVTAERIILLDMQPLFSLSVLERVIPSRAEPGSSDIMHDVLFEVQNLRNMVYTLSICNVVLVVTDYLIDTELYRYIRIAEMLKFGVPDLATLNPNLSGEREKDGLANLPGTNAAEYPDIIFVNNKMAASDFSISVFEDTSCVLQSLFKSSKLRTTGSTTSYPHIPFYRIPPTPTPPVSSINLTFLPEFDLKVTSSAVAPKSPSVRKQQTKKREDSSVVTEIIEKDDICIGWFNAVGKLRNMVFSVKRSGKKSGLSERDWLKNSSKLWDYLRRSDFVAEYQRLLKRLSQGKD